MYGWTALNTVAFLQSPPIQNFLVTAELGRLVQISEKNPKNGSVSSAKKLLYCRQAFRWGGGFREV